MWIRWTRTDRQKIMWQKPFFLFLRVAEHLCAGRAVEFPFGDPERWDQSLSRSRSLSAARAYGMASAVELKNTTGSDLSQSKSNKKSMKKKVKVVCFIRCGVSLRFSEQIQMVKYCCISCDSLMPSMICCTVVLFPCFSSTVLYDPSMR